MNFKPRLGNLVTFRIEAEKSALVLLETSEEKRTPDGCLEDLQLVLMESVASGTWTYRFPIRGRVSNSPQLPRPRVQSTVRDSESCQSPRGFNRPPPPTTTAARLDATSCRKRDYIGETSVTPRDSRSSRSLHSLDIAEHQLVETGAMTVCSVELDEIEFSSSWTDSDTAG
ncbi:hypothetical protein K0M31_003412 [Melipona bicolor]|uniref:Uncharacterized protein n=1 Tax=Melipona bicolor TaxID=60889 RepID=A0AA40FYY2_9HYME|nr:hypothetical protein K0M31_003412 [Melipona bicolor]